MSAIPKTIKVGHRVIRVEQRRRNDDAWLGDDAVAYFLPRGDTMVIDTDIPPHMKRQALLHELIHALLSGYEVPKGDQNSEELEHWFIRNIEETLLGALRDNKSLVAYLTATDGTRKG